MTHSRDGWLPPGVTDRDIDEAAPGYWENPNDFQEEQQYLINLERDRLSFECAFDRLREEFNDIDWLKARIVEMAEALMK